MIKESGNAEVLEIKKQIDVLKQQRKTAMYNLHQSRRKLEYKEKEQVSVAKRIESDEWLIFVGLGVNLPNRFC